MTTRVLSLIIAATSLTIAVRAQDLPPDGGAVAVNASQRAFISRLRPVVGNGAALFEPEVSVVTTGVLNDVQATVSADRKYVTMTMRPTNSQLIALREFSFQTAGLPAGVNGGFVGGAGAGQAGVVAGVNAGVGNENAVANDGAEAKAKKAPARAAVARQTNKSKPQARPAAQAPAEPSILDRPGMTRVASLDD